MAHDESNVKENRNNIISMWKLCGRFAIEKGISEAYNTYGMWFGLNKDIFGLGFMMKVNDIKRIISYFAKSVELGHRDMPDIQKFDWRTAGQLQHLNETFDDDEDGEYSV
jgi:hypothetical protein